MGTRLSIPGKARVACVLDFAAVNLSGARLRCHSPKQVGIDLRRSYHACGHIWHRDRRQPDQVPWPGGRRTTVPRRVWWTHRTRSLLFRGSAEPSGRPTCG